MKAQAMLYAKTAAGQQALKDRSLLTPAQRAAFIQFDGKRSLDDILQANARLGVGVADVDRLLALGFLVSVGPSLGVPAATAASAHPGAVATPEATHDAQERYKKAYPLAAQLTGNLGLRGFRLNLAVEGAADLDALKALLPDIRRAVGPDKVQALEDALSG